MQLFAVTSDMHIELHEGRVRCQSREDLDCQIFLIFYFKLGLVIILIEGGNSHSITSGF